MPPVAEIVSSPLLRARETADVVSSQLRPDESSPDESSPDASRAAVSMVVDDGWAELSYGDWEDRPVADVAAADWNAWRADAHFAPPGGESLMALTERVWLACERAARAARDGDTVVVCSHVSPIKAAVAWALGVDDLEAAVALSWRMHVDQAQMTWVGFRRGEPVLWSFNSTEHLMGPAWDAAVDAERARR